MYAMISSRGTLNGIVGTNDGANFWCKRYDKKQVDIKNVVIDTMTPIHCDTEFNYLDLLSRIEFRNKIVALHERMELISFSRNHLISVDQRDMKIFIQFHVKLDPIDFPENSIRSSSSSLIDVMQTANGI